MSVVKVTCYRCPECGELITESDLSSPLDCWVCVSCGTVYETEQEAKSCCSED